MFQFKPHSAEILTHSSFLSVHRYSEEPTKMVSEDLRSLIFGFLGLKDETRLTVSGCCDIQQVVVFSLRSGRSSFTRDVFKNSKPCFY